LQVAEYKGEDEIVPLWRLKPIDLSDPNWEASSHKGAVIVRASNEEAARQVADKAFAIKTRFPPGHGVIAPPWLRPALVSAERISDPRFSSEGPDVVLEPSFEGGSQ
jgi:hypothetical protein